MSQISATQSAADAVGGSQDLMGLAVLGKTALALGLVIVVILACSYLLRRINTVGKRGGHHLKVVTSTAIGQRERVVIVDVEGTWLVLGVGGGQVTTLHELPAPSEPECPTDSSPDDTGRGFAARFATALKDNTRSSLGRHGNRSPRQEDPR